MDGLQNLPDEVRQYILYLEKKIQELEQRLKAMRILIHHHQCNDSKGKTMVPIHQGNVVLHQVTTVPRMIDQNLMRSSR